ncbi:SHQ1 protein-domain-containing protein [Radiomyces spectabilis]|uniref:SHQ1 protein-domain-containing protein n=1 Tax=Radiomyces spectabilis TaxID=64574 RepID=UPI0022205CAC|nr:SHQ1 protein-domain-containing protein [Radiomyces spectabilis]KAI8393944.1 SHQ1 protein-domain-containing protein [Radiomyces spectabilis]
MITPSFKVDQDDNSVTIVIKTPYVRAQDVDLHVQGTEFRFFLRPYFLRLYLPGNLVEDDDSKAVYDPSAGEFTVKISKETKGEHFQDLDLLTKLLARKGESVSAEAKGKKPLIEVVGGDAMDTEPISELKDAENFNWELPQELPQDELLVQSSCYGFNNQYNGYFTHVEETPNEINDIPAPEKSTTESRRQIRVEQEDLKFDEDYYAMDYVNDEEIQHLIKYKTIWSKELRRIQKNAKSEDASAPKNALIQEVQSVQTNGTTDLDLASLSITDTAGSLVKLDAKDEKLMRNLPNKEYLLSHPKTTYLGLVDILFAYSYNHRTSEGENTVESVWCIGKVSSSMACLEQFSTLKETVIACYRRALSYPLYRNFELCNKVLQDVYVLFRLGKRAILKALLEIKDLFDHHDVYYIYSKIWLDDYCVWIQHASDHVIRTLAHELHHFTLGKNDLGWDLVELEELAREMKTLEESEQNGETTV